MAANTNNIIVWGDSVARGVVYDEKRERYALSPVTAAGIVSEKLGIKVINRARMGFTVHDGVKAIERDLARGIAADTAIIEFGGNDCDFDWQKISDAPDDHHLPHTPVEEYEERLCDIVSTVQEAGIRPVLVTLPPIMAERYFDFISRGGLSRENILRWLGDKNHIYRYHERYSSIVNRIAAKYHCKLLDIRAAFLAVWNTSPLFCADGIHPSEAGQKFIGEAILSSL